MQIPQVNKAQVEGFAKVWRYKGLSMILNEMHVQFTTDFANVMLKNFVMQVAAQQQAAAKAKNIITEGV
jgi:molybdopterin biosynthesis enzyme MoaB